MRIHLYEKQYEYIKRNRSKYAEYSRLRYHELKNDPEKFVAYQSAGKAWREANKESIRIKQKENKRLRKLEAITYLGGACRSCGGEYHPSVFEFHHLDPNEKDKDPSKLLGHSWDKLKTELDKCDLLCANCHRLVHNNWKIDNVGMEV